MNAKSQSSKRRTPQFRAMQTLGFFDDSPVYTDTQFVKHASTPQTAVLTSLADLTPIATERRLGGRNYRWSIIVMTILGLGVALGGGLWLWDQPRRVEAAAADAITDSATALHKSAEETIDITATLASGSFSDTNRLLNSIAALEARARLLLEDAALLDQESPLRAPALAAADQATLATRGLQGAISYAAAVDAGLVPVLLETDPDLIDVGTAVQAFVAWRTSYERLVEVLPVGLAPSVDLLVGQLSSRLEQLQQGYADAIRNEDGPAALSAVTELDSAIEEIRKETVAVLVSEVSEADEHLRSALVQVEELLG